MPHQAVTALCAWLKERHAAIMACEKNALQALYEDKNQALYETLMRNKAEAVAALDTDAASLLEALPDAARNEAQSALHRFSSSARNGLRIGSVFYYSSLLYPDEHTDGEPDNLERLILELEHS